MAERIRANRFDFLKTYKDAEHIRQMDKWVKDNPKATISETTVAFLGFINKAMSNGKTVSNHISGRAMDISWPNGSDSEIKIIKKSFEDLGAKQVVQEPDAPHGKHWHIDW